MPRFLVFWEDFSLRTPLARFCAIARGSASELEYHLLLAHDLKLIESHDYGRMAEATIEIKRMLTALIQKLNAES